MLIFSWPLWFSGMAIFYVGASGRYYIRLFSSLSDVGLYELAAKFTAILGLIIWQPFSQFWDIERFKIYRQPDAQNTYQQFFSIICLLMAIGTLGISTFSGSVIKLMAGAEFHDASKAVPILTIGAMFSALATFFNFSFLVKEKTSWILRNNFIIAGVVTLLYVLMTPKLGFLGAAIALCVAQIVQFLWVFYASQRTYCMGISLTKALPAPILSAVLSIGVGSILWETDIATDIALRTLFFACCTALVAFCSPDFHHIKEKVYQYINNKEKLKKT
jgi:O-antigen/teichoic acid export membrane protein